MSELWAREKGRGAGIGSWRMLSQRAAWDREERWLSRPEEICRHEDFKAELSKEPPETPMSRKGRQEPALRAGQTRPFLPPLPLRVETEPVGEGRRPMAGHREVSGSSLQPYPLPAGSSGHS